MDELIRASINMDTVLETIKSDLIQLRNKDIQILRQLIQISETIQQISKRQNQQRPLFNSKGYLSQVLMFVNPSSVSVRVETPMVRQQSVPAYCRMKSNASTCTFSSSTSSIEGFESTSSTDENSINYTNYINDTDSHPFGRQLSLPVQKHHWQRPKSASFMSRDHSNLHPGDQHWEDVLLTNVYLWKQTQQSDEDSVFIDDANILHRV